MRRILPDPLLGERRIFRPASLLRGEGEFGERPPGGDSPPPPPSSVGDVDVWPLLPNFPLDSSPFVAFHICSEGRECSDPETRGVPGRVTLRGVPGLEPRGVPGLVPRGESGFFSGDAGRECTSSGELPIIVIMLASAAATRSIKTGFVGNRARYGRTASASSAFDAASDRTLRMLSSRDKWAPTSLSASSATRSTSRVM